MELSKGAGAAVYNEKSGCKTLLTTKILLKRKLYKKGTFKKKTKGVEVKKYNRNGKKQDKIEELSESKN